MILSTGRFFPAEASRVVIICPPGAGPLALAVTAAFGLGGITVSAWGPRLPAIKADLDVGTATLGLLLAGATVGAILGLLASTPCCTGWAAAGRSRERSCSSPPR